MSVMLPRMKYAVSVIYFVFTGQNFHVVIWRMASMLSSSVSIVSDIFWMYAFLLLYIQIVLLWPCLEQPTLLLFFSPKFPKINGSRLTMSILLHYATIFLCCHIFFARTCDSSESWVFALNIYYMSRCIPFDIHMNENMQLSWEKSCSLFICVSWHLVLLSVIRAMVC